MIPEDKIQKLIEAIFDKHDHHGKVISDLYRMVLPGFDECEKVDGYPDAGENVWKFICKKCQEFDRIHHPGYFPGGAWLDFGFSINKELDPWDIRTDNCQLVFRLAS